MLEFGKSANISTCFNGNENRKPPCNTFTNAFENLVRMLSPLRPKIIERWWGLSHKSVHVTVAMNLFRISGRAIGREVFAKHGWTILTKLKSKTIRQLVCCHLLKNEFLLKTLND